ncbi:hypothetical protein AB6A40_009041 [Gnathostoma spinigerum]|uniref:Cullin N-terminal domain-containing protein n=1 Tax=Gnathostoma spinigerum TaxID=75299 RepID=A0ABD6ET73_9BILA
MCSTSTATSAVVEATKVSSELGDRIEKEAQSAYSEGRRVQKEKSSVIFPAPAAKRARRTSMDCAMAEDSVDDPGDKDGETPSVISDDHPVPPVGLPINGTVRPLSRGHCGTGPSTYRTGINRNGQFGSSNPSSNTGPKRVVIKNFRHRKSESSADQFESNWKILEEAVIAIQRKEKIHTGLEELYKTVENLCSYNLTNEMYLKLRQCILVHVTNELGRLLSESNAMLYFLQSLNNLWLEHCQQMVMIRSIFLFFDRTFVLQNSSILSLWDLGSEIFRDVIMKNDDVCNRSVGGILSLIETERQGSQIDRQLVKSLLRMMSSLSIYQTVFEKPFLDATKALYEVEGRNLSRDLDVSAYLKHVKRRLDEESNRVDYYLDFGTRKMLISITEQCFIVEHMDSFISRGKIKVSS